MVVFGFFRVKLFYIKYFLVVDYFIEGVYLEEELFEFEVVVVLIGLFVVYFGVEFVEKMKVFYYGNKVVLRWESDCFFERKWLEKVKLRFLRIYEDLDDIDGFVIVKLFGVGGGRGYFLVSFFEDFWKKVERLGVCSKEDFLRV